MLLQIVLIKWLKCSCSPLTCGDSKFKQNKDEGSENKSSLLSLVNFLGIVLFKKYLNNIVLKSVYKISVRQCLYNRKNRKIKSQKVKSLFCLRNKSMIIFNLKHSSHYVQNSMHCIATNCCKVKSAHLNIKVILCASEHICSIVRYCFRRFKQL